MRHVTYSVFVRILGGDWALAKPRSDDFDCSDLALVLGLADAFKDEIRETMVVKVTMSLDEMNGVKVVRKTYELVE